MPSQIRDSWGNWINTDTLVNTGGEQTIRLLTTTLTDAQVKALPTTPVTLVAAAGADTFLHVLTAFVRVDTSNNGYGNIDGSAYLIVTYTGEDAGAAQGLIANGGDATDLTNLLTSFDNTSAVLEPYTVATVDAAANKVVPALLSMSDAVNKGLIIKASNGVAGNWTGGNAANEMSVTVLYTVVDL